MNFALAHVLGATIQTALFNSSLVVIVGWGLHKEMVIMNLLPSLPMQHLTLARDWILKSSTSFF